ncbi:MAG: hypothetical protein JXA73_06650 [Acidobacteria bacterium]|nr:hypothetical protein [Acidobacteriota bacterium]
MAAATAKLERELAAKYGESQKSRIQRGLKQLSESWRNSDGDQAFFEEFVAGNFAGDTASLDTMFSRFQYLFEQAFGHMYEISREFRQQTDLDSGPVQPFDEIFAAYDPSAHLMDDFFNNKLAFVVLLNFPLTTLDQKLSEGDKWTRRQWAETRLAEYFSKRIPAEVNLAISKAAAESEQYISEYNIWAHHLIDDKGTRLFPPGLRLLSHWNLRDQIKADYQDSQNGFARQRIIEKVMERIVTQTIPASVINNPQLDWNPYANEVKPVAEKDSDFVPGVREAANTPEPNTRYRHLLETYRASKLADPYSPNAPTLIARRFEEDRQIPEERVQKMFEQVLASPLVPQVAALIQRRLGRPLESFDIWYNGFKPNMKYTQIELDSLVAGRFPTAKAYEKAIPSLLEKLGFSPDRAAFAAANIVVDPARGSGHAMGAAMRQAKAHLRTRVGKEGMNYKGFNIAVHEMGHNVEQTFSLNAIDYYSLNGVPNTAFTEALAFVFQGRDLELLGLQPRDAQADALKALNDFWATFEICGVSLVDMRVWHWLYDHPQTTPEQLRDAVLQISRDIWNQYYAPVFHKKDVVLLGVYSHMIHSFLYLPDYPLGHMIAFQLEEHMKKAGRIGPEFERVSRQGRIAPDLWMRNATGSPVGPEALLTAAERALNLVRN